MQMRKVIVKELKEVYRVGTGSRFIEEEKAKYYELETRNLNQSMMI